MTSVAKIATRLRVSSESAAGNSDAVLDRHQHSRLLAEVGHDLRQPVYALGLYVAELRRKVSGREQQLLVGQVERSVDAITTLIDTLLDISRLEAGIDVADRQLCDISALLGRVEEDFGMMAKAENIRLIVRPFRGQVISDPVLLARILMNLVSNALRYTNENGTVLIACRRRDGHILIEVRDNGIGIAKARQADIFREFFQMHPGGVQKGLGLGLAIVHRLAVLLGHRITLRSVPGRGSIFTLWLRCAKVCDEKPIKSSLNTMCECCPLTGKSVLIVDGGAQVQDSTASILASWGAQITALSSMESVVHRLAKGARWDLVVSDYRIEKDATGLDVIRMVRERLGAKTPAILISSYSSDAPMKSAIDAGDVVLYKPVKPAKLRSVVQYLMAKATIAG